MSVDGDTAPAVLITGGGDGLGFELARRYVERGSRVTILDTRQARPVAGATFLERDVRVVGESEIASFPELDVVVLNAGISLSGDFVAQEPDRYREVFEVNALAHIELTRRLLRQRRIRRGARLGVVLSCIVYAPWPAAVAYASSKSALDGFALAMSSYLRGHGVSVTRIFPGPMATSHQRYYAGMVQGRGVPPGPGAGRIVTALERRRARVFPDTGGRLLYLGSVLAPGLMRKLMYDRYRDYCYR